MDCNTPYMPFGTVLLIYAVIDGIPLMLAVMAAIICRKRLKEPPFRWNWDYGLGLLAVAAPLSAIMTVCIRLLTSRRPFLILLSQQIGFLAPLLIAGGIFCGLRIFLRRRGKTK